MFSAPLAVADPALEQQLQDLVAEAFSHNAPGGAVIVRSHGETVLHRAFGMADLELGVPMAKDHRMAAGSITKSFTAAAILLLVQKGELTLEDDIRKYLDDVSPGESAITVAQLLTHTSGFPSAVDREDFDRISKTEHSVKDLLALTEGMPLHFPPGSGFRYSDSGYFLLGALIEQRSGLDYAKFMQLQVFEPAGLERTVYGDERRIIDGRVPGYSRDESGFINAPYIHMSIPYSAGGIYTTVEDLADWIDVLNSGRLIEPGLLERAWTPHRLPDGTPLGYGFGWDICEISGLRSIGHGGFINGFTANLEFLPEAKLTVAAMTNQDVGEPESTYLVRRIVRLILTGSPELQLAELDAKQRRSLLGIYRYENGDLREILEQDGILYSRRNGNDPVRLLPLSADFLAFPETEGTYGLRFSTMEQGRNARAETRLNCNLQAIATRLDD